MYGVVEGAGWGRFPIFRCSRTQFFQAQHAPKSSHELKASGKLQTRAAGKAENREASNVNANPLYEECVILEGPNLLEKRGSRSRALTLSRSATAGSENSFSLIWDFTLSRWFVFPVVRAIWQLHSAPKEMSFEVFQVDFHLQSLINMNVSQTHLLICFSISLFSFLFFLLFAGFSFSG